MSRSFCHGSGMVIITASGSGTSFIIRNSSVLSSIAESLPAALMTGSTLSMSSCMTAEDIVSSRAIMRSTFPRMVLISPLWRISRLGCARSQLGKVFVEKRECTMAMALSPSSA